MHKQFAPIEIVVRAIIPNVADMAFNLTEIIENLKCCLADKAWVVAHGDLLGLQCNPEKAILMNAKWQIVKKFQPAGTITITGVFASADLDFTGTTLGTQSGVVTIDLPNGTPITVGFFSGTYATISDLIDDIIAGLLNGWTGVNNDPILTLTAPVNLGVNPVGGTVTITFQPEFGKDAGTDVGGGATPKGSCTVNEPTSACYRLTFTSNNNTNRVGVWDYDTFITNIVLPVGSQPNDCCYDPVNKRIYVPCANQVNVERINCAVNPPVLLAPLAFANLTASCVFNTVDACKYITVQASNRLARVTAGDAITFSLGLYNSLTPIEVDQYSGNIWIGSGGINRLYIVDHTNIDNILVQSDLATTINGAITFYPNADPTLRRMFISDYFGQKIQSWNLDGTLDDPAFITLTSNPNTVFYSAQFDKLFVSNGSVINVYNMDGTPYTVPITIGTPPAQTINNFGDDIFHEATFGISVLAGADNLQFFKLFEAQDEVEGEFDGTVTQHVRTADENCQTEEMIEDAAEELQIYCGGCGDCSGDIQDINSSGGGTVTAIIYYGRSANPALDTVGIQALTTINLPNFVYTYPFPALASTYCYVAVPASFGLPTSIIDPGTGFSFAMNTPYAVTILGATYNVWRSENMLGGNTNAQFIQ